jgi:hypothetical protein
MLANRGQHCDMSYLSGYNTDRRGAIAAQMFIYSFVAGDIAQGSQSGAVASIERSEMNEQEFLIVCHAISPYIHPGNGVQANPAMALPILIRNPSTNATLNSIIPLLLAEGVTNLGRIQLRNSATGFSTNGARIIQHESEGAVCQNARLANSGINGKTRSKKREEGTIWELERQWSVTGAS